MLGDAQPKSREWNWHPEVSIRVSPLFRWPLRPFEILRWF